MLATLAAVLLVTWNVNSLKARLPRLLELLEQHRPDLVCLQETKCEAGAFPHMELEAAGYRKGPKPSDHAPLLVELAR